MRLTIAVILALLSLVLPVTVRSQQQEGGSARLIGIENGDLSDVGNYLSDEKRLVRGRLLVFVRTTVPGGLYRVELSAAGVPPMVVGNTK